MSLSDFFDCVYCINLDERVDRWKDSVEALKQLGLPTVTRFPAIKHENGAIGCRASHVSIIQHAKDSKFNKILVLEDDFRVLPGEDDHIDKALQELDNIDWEIFYFGATIAPGATVTPVTERVAHTNFAYTTHAYALNSNIFDYVLEAVKKYKVIDVFYNQQVVSRGKGYVINPLRIVQRECYSDIEQKHADYSVDMINFFEMALKKGTSNDKQ